MSNETPESFNDFLDRCLESAPWISLGEACDEPDGSDYSLTIANAGDPRASLVLNVVGDNPEIGRPGLWQAARVRLAVVDWDDLLAAGVDLTDTLGPLRLFELGDATLDCLAQCVVAGFADSAALAPVAAAQEQNIREWLRRQLAGIPHGDNRTDPDPASTLGPTSRRIVVDVVAGPDQSGALVVWQVDPDVTVSHDSISKGDTSGDTWTSRSSDAQVDVTSTGSRVKAAYSGTSKLISTASGWISVPANTFVITHAGPDHTYPIRYDVKGTGYTVS